MSLLELSIFFSFSAAAVWGSGFLACAGLRRLGAIDVPNGRSSHQRPTVRGGGVTILLVVLGWLILNLGNASLGSYPVLLGLLLVAGISFIDDLRSLPLSLRLVVHGVGAACVLWALSHDSSPVGITWIGYAILIWFLVVGFINAFNFFDGINGLASSQALLTCLFGALICAIKGDFGDPAMRSLIVLQVILGGAVAGFLPHNFPKSRMFLGDVGSISIGFTIATIAVLAWHHLGWQVGVALCALQINVVMDTCLTVLRRAFRGAHLHLPHREFFFHKLVRSGVSHTVATGLETGIQLVSGAALVAVIALNGTPLALLTVIFHIIAGWMLFLGWCELRFRSREDDSEGKFFVDSQACPRNTEA